MSDEFVVSNEQIDEEWQRFKNLTPKLQTDPRFCSSVGVSDVKIMPVVYLTADETGNNQMPQRYIAVFHNEDNYRLSLMGFFNLLGVGIPANFIPYEIEPQNLDTEIIKAWENWFDILKGVEEQKTLYLRLLGLGFEKRKADEDPDLGDFVD